MGKRIAFVVPGAARPEAKRTSRSFLAKDGKTVVQGRRYEPADRRDWKSDVRKAAAAAVNGPALEGPLTLRVMVLRPVPKSTPKKPCKGNWWPWAWWKKPDTDNLVKPIKDACKSVVWLDDAQVVWDNTWKLNSDRNCVVVVVEEASKDDLRYAQAIADKIRCECGDDECDDGCDE